MPIDFRLHRPVGYFGQGDQYFPEIFRHLNHVLRDAQRSLTYDTLRLPEARLKELASVLIEFAEDMHNDVGIWESLERYNVEFFGTPLPLVSEPTQDVQQEGINKYRVRHLLWVLYPELVPELVLSPTHGDLCLLAEKVSDFLRDRFADVPRSSGVKAFLGTPNQFGWDVKKKLIWLGQHSYLFRHAFENYIESHSGKREIPIIDDFVCQHTTCWSGLGVIDILAATLDIPEEQRADLRSWHQRHLAYFRILAVRGPLTDVMNLVNDKPYVTRVVGHVKQFKVGQIVFGSLVPWDTEWYWSGVQSVLNNVGTDVLEELTKDLIQKTPTIVYRYCDELALKAKERVAAHYRDFVEYFGDDLVVYPDGLSMAAGLQKYYHSQFESQPVEVVSNLIKKYNLPGPFPKMSVPANLLENDDGVGVYFNPEEGQEMMTGFHTIVDGFKKKGVDLSEDEQEGIRSLVCSDAISPRFVEKLVRQYGDESIAAAFLVRDHTDRSYVDYLLRRYKGHFYRQRYPCLTIV